MNHHFSIHMDSKEKEIKYSSQVILRDTKGILYLERNTHLWVISFWWGGREADDSDEFETALRELREELGIVFRREDLKLIDKDKPQEFPKGIFVSTLFLIDIDETIVQEIMKNSKTVNFTIDQIKDSHESFVLWKENFFKRVSKIMEL
jgi:8-oxo-dGTP pyrophosphatase MutT (NUDIX family)